jgi:putative ABC transport system permease protein
MLRNYFITAWRNILRNKAGSFINVFGLTMGITCALLIAIFIQNELSYDRFHKDANRIYQVILNGNMNDEEFWAGNTPPPVGAALFNNIPEIESYTRFYKPNDVVVRFQENGTMQKFFTERNVLAVDSNFLQVFDFKKVEGDAATALMKPGSVAITETMAKKYFGKENGIGKTLLIGQGKQPFEVTAIAKDPPAQSSIQFDFLTPMADHPVVKNFNWSWVWLQTVCYVKLKPGVSHNPSSLRQLESKFPGVIRIQAADGFNRLGKPFDEFVKSGGKWNFHLLPLTHVHLRSGGVGMRWLHHISDIKYTYIFGSIALFVILLACVNFMNLSTARAASRAKEVGIRKVAGSTKAQLVRQFLSEALLYSLICSFLAMGLTALLLPGFSSIMEEPVQWQTAFTPKILGVLMGLTIMVGLLAGIYPAFYLTSFKPVAVLKGNNLFTSQRKTPLVRNGLVVFQFTISTIMIIGTLVVLKQLKFLRNTDLGFNKENVMVIAGTNRLATSEESFRQAITQVPGVLSAGKTTSIPSGNVFEDAYLPEPENVHTTKEINLSSFMVDEAFIPTLNLKVLQGRNFSAAFNDSAFVILNEEAVKQIGWKSPVGKWIDYPGGNMTRFKVAGVVKNFHTESLRTGVAPFALFHSSSKTYDLGVSFIVAKIKADDLNKTISQLESRWKTFVTGEPFEYNFLDAAFDAQYRSEQRLGSIFSLFATICIFIACLGLFGLCAYVAERRTKEIGIRKVLGASVESVVVLITRDFLKLTFVAVMVAFPMAWWAMNKWLEGFAYRIPIHWTIFFMAGISTLLIAVITISVQAVRAAIANPLKNLRTE